MLTRTGVPLASLSTLQVGGPARSLLEPETESELVDAVLEHPEALVLGGGSNVVLPDAGLDEVVLVGTRGFAGDASGVWVQAGEDWDAFVQNALVHGFHGVEALSGIPGTVGAAPIQNVGAYGQEVAEHLVAVRVLDRRTGAVVELPAAECGFSYRHSAFKAEPRRWVVLAVRFSLPEGRGSGPIRYAELARALDVELGSSAPATEVREAVLALRRRKGMVLDAADPDTRSAGSFFTNPVVPDAPEGAPTWPAGDGLVKVSAAWLIEQAGFTKGWGDGPARLSSKHALAIVNRGGARAEDVIALARQVRDGVRAKTGITLHPEPVVVGADPDDPLRQP